MRSAIRYVIEYFFFFFFLSLSHVLYKHISIPTMIFRSLDYIMHRSNYHLFALMIDAKFVPREEICMGKSYSYHDIIFTII